MKRLLYMTLLTAILLTTLAAFPAWAGDIITVTDFDEREIWGFGELWVETLSDYLVEEYFDEPLDEDPWVSGVVGDIFHDHGQAIGIGDQNSYVSDGPTSASFHADGFASGDVVAGGVNPDDLVDGWAEGSSDVDLGFRVEVPTDFILTGSVWSSGVGEEAFGRSYGIGWIDAYLGQAFDVNVQAISDQIPFHVTGTLQPGISYHIRAGADADTYAEYDDDTGIAHHYYSAGGYDISLFLSPSVSAVAGEPGAALSVLAYPNPTSGRTQLQFAAPRGTTGTVEIFDVRGRRVRQWADVPAAGALLDWDGRGADGRPAAAGTYFVRARSGADEVRRKLVLTH